MIDRSRFRLPALVLTSVLMSCSGGDGGGTAGPNPTPEQPRATTIEISPSDAALAFLGETTNFTATVRDQNGSVMSLTVTWTSNNTAVVEVNSSGQATAIGNGTASITAAASGLSASVQVQVEQVASQLLVLSGDNQTGGVGEALADPLVVQVSDAGGNGMATIPVTFSVTGGGSLSGETTSSDAEGRASTEWTLGTNTAEGQQVTATIAGDVDAVFNATVEPGAPTSFTKVTGDGQEATRGITLPNALIVEVLDEFGNPVVGVDVDFAVTEGGGSVDPATAQIDETGRAQTAWTLGPNPGDNTATASIAGFAALEFTATGVGVPDLLVAGVTTSPSTVTPDQNVTFNITLRNDGDGPNSVAVPVNVTVDGTLLGDVESGVIAGNGGTRIVTFEAGTFDVGDHALIVEVDPDDMVEETDEGNNVNESTFEVESSVPLTSGVPVTGLSGAEDSETFFSIEVGSGGGGAPVSFASGPVASSVERRAATQKFNPAGLVRPGAVSGGNLGAFVEALQISLSGGSAGQDADLYVKFGSEPTTDDFDFSSLSSTSTESVTINAPQEGTWYILVHGFTAYSDVTLSAEVGDVEEEEEEETDFDIELVFISEATQNQTAAFESARARWQAAITADLADANFANNPLAADTCIDGQGEISDIVDDLRIFISLIEIDGAFGTLGRAGPCWVRGNLLTIVGIMEFDTADLDFLEGQNQLVPVVLHEMGHVLGIGSLWSSAGLLVNPSLPDNQGADTHFTGTNAIAAFDAAGGDAYVDGEKVPVENMAGAGSGDSHWREALMENELMTPSLNAGSNPLSAISLASLIDLGYQVDTGTADGYTLDLGGLAPPRTLSPPISLHGDVIDRPILVIGPDGRVQRVIRR